MRKYMDLEILLLYYSSFQGAERARETLLQTKTYALNADESYVCFVLWLSYYEIQGAAIVFNTVILNLCIKRETTFSVVRLLLN